MNQEVKEKWVKALRSGDYKQGTLVLRSTTNEFCCLGVLEDIMIPETGFKWLKITENGYYEIGFAKGILNYETKKLTDITTELEDHLISLNDNGKTFEEIADYIENL